MATFQVTGLDLFVAKLNRMGQKTEGICKRAVYEGAHVVLETVQAAIEALPVIKNRYHVTELPLGGVTETQKRGLLAGFGSSTMRNDNGFINTKISFDGYNSVRSKKYPNGQPNMLIARALNSGSSARSRLPFFDKAIKAARAPAKSAMEASFNADVEEIMK